MDKKHVFTPTEKSFFTHILKKYSTIIENKDTDGASLRKKNKTWERLTAEFNSSPLASSQATTKQLRRLWVNLKQRQREALIKERQQRQVTRGGRPASDAEIEPDPSAVAPALIAGIDSDTIQEVKCSSVDVKPMVTDEEIPLEPEVIIHLDERLTATQLSPESLPLRSPRSTTPQQFSISPPHATPPPATLRVAHSKTISKNNITDREYKERTRRANEKHHLEMLILKEQLRECKAKADLAELILKQKLDSLGNEADSVIRNSLS